MLKSVAADFSGVDPLAAARVRELCGLRRMVGLARLTKGRVKALRALRLDRLERFGRRFVPAFAGALVVEATKQVYQGLPVRQRQSRRVFVPVLAPQGASTTGASSTPSPAKKSDISKRGALL